MKMKKEFVNVGVFDTDMVADRIEAMGLRVVESTCVRMTVETETETKSLEAVTELMKAYGYQ